MRFYLGTHEETWLARSEVDGLALFVSHARLSRRPYRLPRATTDWALDSGAFSEVAQCGEFTTTPKAYVAAVARYRDEVGRMIWAAPQDHMTEAFVLARSRLASTVAEAQHWTTANYLELRSLDASLPIVPVLQGQTLADYRRHAEDYERAGIDLLAEAVVGLGSVCRRQATDEIAQLVAALSGDGLALHGFGVKTEGLRRYGWALASADSMAWSYRGRRVRPCPHTGAASCANCMPHALAWRARAMTDEARPVQLELTEATA